MQEKPYYPAPERYYRCNKQFRSLLNGVAVQDRDLKVGGRDGEVRSVTEKQVTPEQMADLIFANKIVKNSKSNAIVFAKNGQLLASGIVRPHVWMHSNRL